MSLPYIPFQPDLNILKLATIALNGINPTSVTFAGGDGRAVLLSANRITFSLSTTGLTLIAAVNGGSPQTATFTCIAGKETSAASPSTDLTLTTTPNFKLAINGDATPKTVTLTAANCTTGATTAAEMQTQIQALGGVYAAVTATYTSSKYVITSSTKGTGSTVRITVGDTNDCSVALKIGAANGAVDVDGTGDFVNAAVATIAEVNTVVAAAITNATISDVGGGVSISSKSVGAGSSVVMGNGTANTALGFTNGQSIGGSQSLAFERNMADAGYYVLPALSGTTSLASKGLSVTNRTVSGFDIHCETISATDNVVVMVAGRV